MKAKGNKIPKIEKYEFEIHVEGEETRQEVVI